MQLWLIITFRVWVVWEYEALPYQISNNLNTSTND
jgi:hypothetical protein